MPRAFLFPQDSADAATTRLIAVAAEATGFMKGMPGDGPGDWYRPGADNAAFLAALRDALAATYPDAAPLWAVRLWTNLIWQPAYLAVIGVHLHGAVPELKGLSQAREGIYVNGYRLRPAPQWSGPVEAMIEQAAGELQQLTAGTLGEINTMLRLRPLPARRLLADRMLSLMVWLAGRRREVPPGTIRQWSALWLDGLGLSGQGDLQGVERGGHELLIVQRKGCCLDYLVDPDRLCASCPRQPDQVRIARQTANALAELG